MALEYFIQIIIRILEFLFPISTISRISQISLSYICLASYKPVKGLSMPAEGYLSSRKEKGAERGGNCFLGQFILLQVISEFSEYFRLGRAHPIFSGASLINYYICIMENNALLSLVSLMLPSNILSRFTLVKVESTDDTISIHLDEKIPSDYQNNPNIESKGFLSPVTVRDFPIRDKAVNLIVRRRRWLDLHTAKCFTLPYDDIKSENTRYSKEFAAFLKEVYGDEAYDLPFA